MIAKIISKKAPTNIIINLLTSVGYAPVHSFNSPPFAIKFALLKKMRSATANEGAAFVTTAGHNRAIITACSHPTVSSLIAQLHAMDFIPLLVFVVFFSSSRAEYRKIKNTMLVIEGEDKSDGDAQESGRQIQCARECARSDSCATFHTDDTKCQKSSTTANKTSATTSYRKVSEPFCSDSTEKFTCLHVFRIFSL